MSEANQVLTTMCAGMATVGMSIPLEYRNIWQSNTWILIGSGSNDNLPSLNGRKTAEIAVREHGK